MKKLLKIKKCNKLNSEKYKTRYFPTEKYEYKIDEIINIDYNLSNKYFINKIKLKCNFIKKDDINIKIINKHKDIGKYILNKYDIKDDSFYFKENLSIIKVEKYLKDNYFEKIIYKNKEDNDKDYDNVLNISRYYLNNPYHINIRFNSEKEFSVKYELIIYLGITNIDINYNLNDNTFKIE